MLKCVFRPILKTMAGMGVHDAFGISVQDGVEYALH